MDWVWFEVGATYPKKTLRGSSREVLLLTRIDAVLHAKSEKAHGYCGKALLENEMPLSTEATMQLSDGLRSGEAPPFDSMVLQPELLTEYGSCTVFDDRRYPVQCPIVIG